MSAMKRHTPSRTAVLLIHCPDQKGLVLAVTDFLTKNNGNIVYLDQHVDTGRRLFFMRIEWEVSDFAIPDDTIGETFGILMARKYRMKWQLYFSDEKPRMAVFVSSLSHCLVDILHRMHSGEWKAELPVIISNHPDLEPVARKNGIVFSCIPVTAGNKREAEKAQLRVLRAHRVELVVLARYMQILSPEFISQYPSRIISIHHSFLPAFPGAKPYHSAHERGVKIIGATSHYVTGELDAGPIIGQDVTRVSHADTVDDLVRKGRDLETRVLSAAVRLHLRRKVLTCGNRTVIFS